MADERDRMSKEHCTKKQQQQQQQQLNKQTKKNTKNTFSSTLMLSIELVSSKMHVANESLQTSFFFFFALFTLQ